MSTLTRPLSPVPENEVDPRVAEVAAKVRAMIADGSVDPLSAIAIVRSIASVGASWDIVEDVVGEIAKGADGIAGTPDDLIPPGTLSMLTALLHSGVVRDLVSWAVEVGVPAAGALRPLWVRGVMAALAWLPCFRA